MTASHLRAPTDHRKRRLSALAAGHPQIAAISFGNVAAVGCNVSQCCWKTDPAAASLNDSGNCFIGK
jgi:hypothetical protein